MRITEDEYKALIAGRPVKDAKRSKYGNTKIEIDGHVFDSKKEAARFHELKLMEKAGLIRNIELQPKFDLNINGVHICNYFADFAYYEITVKSGDLIFENVHRVEDVKSAMTRKLPVYRLKMKMLKAIHGITVIEI